jgi:hypothetical protein
MPGIGGWSARVVPIRAENLERQFVFCILVVSGAVIELGSRLPGSRGISSKGVMYAFW